MYSTIVADPPWSYNSQGPVGAGGNRRKTKANQVGTDAHYPTMSVSDICALDVGALAAPQAHLYLWTTNSFLLSGEAAQVALAWGFDPKTILTWCKHRKGDPDAPSRKTGYYFRSATEHVLFCTRGNMRLALDSAEASWFALPGDNGAAFLGERLGHSVKPDHFFSEVERWSPGPYLELFARAPRAGWSVWGNEVASDVVLGVSAAPSSAPGA